jgi:hypothetical protein
LGAVDIVRNPEMAPLAILGILLGFVGTSGPSKGTKEEIREMAKMRSKITPTVVKEWGPVFKRNEAKLQRISGFNMCGR